MNKMEATLDANREVQFVAVGSLDDFAPRIGRVVRLGGEEIAVFKTSDGSVYALENNNGTRRGGSLCEGIVSGEYLYDPLYDTKISLKDGSLQASDMEPVKAFAVRVTDGRVEIGVTG